MLKDMHRARIRAVVQRRLEAERKGVTAKTAYQPPHDSEVILTTLLIFVMPPIAKSGTTVQFLLRPSAAGFGMRTAMIAGCRSGNSRRNMRRVIDGHLCPIVLDLCASAG